MIGMMGPIAGIAQGMAATGGSLASAAQSVGRPAPYEYDAGYGRPGAQMMNPFGMMNNSNPYGGINDQTMMGTYVANRGGGGGGGGGSLGSYLGAQEAAAASRYGSDTDYRIAEGNARSAWDLGNLNANTQRYIRDSESGDARYTSDNNRYGAFDVANLQRQASDYGNLLNYYGRDLESARGLEGALGVADRNMWSNLGVADRNMLSALGVADRNLQGNLGVANINAGSNRYVADRGFESALRQAMIDAGVRRDVAGMGLEGQLAGYGSQERVAKTNIMPQMLESQMKRERFQAVLPLIMQIAGGVLGRMSPAAA